MRWLGDPSSLQVPACFDISVPMFPMQFWEHPAPLPSGPVNFVLQAVNGMSVTASCDDPLKGATLPNF
jgi:hypothetical protein